MLTEKLCCHIGGGEQLSSLTFWGICLFAFIKLNMKLHPGASQVSLVNFKGAGRRIMFTLERAQAGCFLHLYAKLS